MAEPKPGPAAADNPQIPAWAGLFGDAPDGNDLAAQLAAALEQAGVSRESTGLRFAVTRKRRPGERHGGGRCGSVTFDDIDAYGDLEEAIKAQWGGGLYLVRPACPREGKPGVPFVSGMSWEVEIEGAPIAAEEPVAAATPASSDTAMMMMMMQQAAQQQQAMAQQQAQQSERMQREQIASREQTIKLLCAVLPPLIPVMMGGAKGTDLAEVTGALKDLHDISGGAGSGLPVGPYDVVSQGITAMQQAATAGVFNPVPGQPGVPGVPGQPVAAAQPGQQALTPAAQHALNQGLPPSVLTAVQMLASAERANLPPAASSDMAYAIVSSDEKAFGTLVRILQSEAPAVMQAVTNLTGAAPSAWWTAVIAALIGDLPVELERYAEQQAERQAEQRAAAVAAQPAAAALPAPAPTAQPAAPSTGTPPAPQAAPRAAAAQPSAPTNGNGRQAAPASARRPAPPPPPPPPSTALEGVAAPNTAAAAHG